MEPKPPFEAELEGFFLKTLPEFPANVKDIIVQVLPWLALIGGIFGVIGILGSLGLTGISVFTFSGTLMFAGLFTLASNALTAILDLLAFNPLRSNRRQGWNFLYYSVLVATAFSIVAGLLNFPYGIGGIILTIIVAGIELWILFQVRERYY
ncbi:MAG: hypothetical protein QM669_04780 [Siphonobacter sp.]